MCRTNLAESTASLALMALVFYSMYASRAAHEEPKTQNCIVVQDKPNNCGPATLRMILSHHGVEVPLRQLESESKMSVRGASMQGLIRACELHGLRAEGWKLRWNDLRKVSLPIVAYLPDGHFVVVDSVEGEEFVHLRDPSRGRTRLMKEEFLKGWGGDVIIFALPKLPIEDKND